jgi:hypothetical protein
MTNDHDAVPGPRQRRLRSASMGWNRGRRRCRVRVRVRGDGEYDRTITVSAAQYHVLAQTQKEDAAAYHAWARGRGARHGM